MRILHTSDWHLGQHFMGKTREAEHQALVDWLLEQVQVHAVDAVLIAGDIFDTGAPPSYARALYSQLVALQSSWSGEAATAFQSVVAEWKATQHRVEESLAAINQALTLAAQQYAEIELSNARLFGR